MGINTPRYFHLLPHLYKLFLIPHLIHELTLDSVVCHIGMRNTNLNRVKICKLLSCLLTQTDVGLDEERKVRTVFSRELATL